MNIYCFFFCTLMSEMPVLYSVLVSFAGFAFSSVSCKTELMPILVMIDIDRLAHVLC